MDHKISGGKSSRHSGNSDRKRLIMLSASITNTHFRSYELQAHAEDDKHAYMLERYQALVEVCDKWASVGMFAGYGAWLQIRIQTISNHINGQGGH